MRVAASEDAYAAIAEPVARRLFGDPNRQLSTQHELRWGGRGSLSLDLRKGAFFDHEQNKGGGVLDLIRREKGLEGKSAWDWLRAEGLVSDPPARTARREVATYPYRDEAGTLLFEVVRFDPKDFRQRAPNGSGGWVWSLKGVRRVLYRLPELAAADPSAPVFVVEGEKDCDRLIGLGLVATCNAGGAGKWHDDYSRALAGRQVVLVPDNDGAGEEHARVVSASLKLSGVTATVLRLPDLPPKGDVSDWLAQGGTADQLRKLADAAAPDAPRVIQPTPYVWRPPETIPPRQWLYGKHLIRRFLSLTVAPGALGKSSMLMVETLAMITGRPLLGDRMPHALRVWSWNGEDPMEELQRRFQAACMHYQIGPDDIGDRFMMDSGRDLPITLATNESGTFRIATPQVEALTNALIENKVDVLIVDPFVASHAVSENDNTFMNAVAMEWRRIADRANCAIELVHHVTKAGANDAEMAGIYAARGAGALIDAVRDARLLARMTKEEGERFGVEHPERHFRVQSGKPNLAPADKAVWRKMIGVALGNGAGFWPDGDYVGVCTPWTPPDAFEGMTARDLQDVQRAVEACDQPPKHKETANDWVGYLVAEVLGMDLGRGLKKADRDVAHNSARAKVRQLLAEWIRSGALVVEMVHSPRDGRDAPVIVVGDPVSEDDIRGRAA